MNIQILPKDEFNKVARSAHMLCFGEDRDPSVNTFDYALWVVNEQDQPFCYMTILELDKKSCYIQHGGAFPPHHGTIRVGRIYSKMIDYLKERYPRLSTRVCNKNIRMLKLAMALMFVATMFF